MKFGKEILAAGLVLAGTNAVQGETETTSKEKVPHHIENTDGETKSPESNIIKNSRLYEANLTTYFATDKAEISKENQEKIKSMFIDFLSQINQDNADKILLADWNLFVNSDPRPTKKWTGGNPELSLNRAINLESWLKSIITNFDFKNLTPRYAEAFRNKNFNFEMPNSNGEKGVKHIEDLQKPNSKEHYTKEEVEDIEKNDPELYFELLSRCRGAYFVITIIFPVEQTGHLLSTKFLCNFKMSFKLAVHLFTGVPSAVVKSSDIV